MQGIGASLSGLSAGLIVDHFGYGTAFLTAGAAAGLALLVLVLAMPETAPCSGFYWRAAVGIGGHQSCCKR
jgi:sugar phosphate permease